MFCIMGDRDKTANLYAEEKGYITLVSSDGTHFLVKKAMALSCSSKLREMYETSKSDELHLDISSVILVTVIKYFFANYRDLRVVDAEDAFGFSEEMAIDVLHAASYLDC
ncbi:UNVERIFIED_CONTAM: hypothetical protein RMT77_004003 [Armadillidium vulgare]